MSLSSLSPENLAELINAVPIELNGVAPIARAISTAGGIAFDELDADFMIRRLPGVFAAGEMLDWEAPTGGYLLQACFATGAAAGQGVLKWLDRTGSTFRSPALNLAKASSIGFRSGEYGGRYISFAPTASIASRTPATLWLARLSMTTVSPRRERWDEHLLDIDAEGVAVHGAFQHPRRDQTVAAQAAGEGCRLPMAPRGLADEPLAPSTSSVDADHLGVGAGSVDEHQLVGIKARLTGLPALARLSYVGPILLGGVQRFF